MNRNHGGMRVISRRAVLSGLAGCVPVLTARRLAAADAPAAKLKIYIFADMEGISGITSRAQVSREGDRFDEGARLMAEDINACVAGCFDAGATEVVVRDGHGGGLNVDPAAIDPRAKLIRGSTPGVRFKDFKETDALILLGYHAMARTPRAVMAHSYSSASVQGMWLNGREVGEIGVDAAIAADYGVPVVMVSGDDKTAAEADAWIPGVVTVVTKTGTGAQRAELVPVEVSRHTIRSATAAAIRRRAEIRPAGASRPATLRRDYLPQGHPRVYDDAFTPAENPRRVEKTGDSVERLLLDR